MVVTASDDEPPLGTGVETPKPSAERNASYLWEEIRLAHIEIKDLPDKDRFQRLRSEKKHFIDTIKLIAYRAETALAQLAREKIKRLDDVRSLIRQLFRTEVDSPGSIPKLARPEASLIPDQQNKALTVRLHPMTTQAHDEIPVTSAQN